MRGHGRGGVDKQVEALVVAHRRDSQLGADRLFLRAETAWGVLLKVKETGIGVS